MNVQQAIKEILDFRHQVFDEQDMDGETCQSGGLVDCFDYLQACLNWMQDDEPK